jgi:hypothetical protein
MGEGILTGYGFMDELDIGFSLILQRLVYPFGA